MFTCLRGERAHAERRSSDYLCEIPCGKKRQRAVNRHRGRLKGRGFMEDNSVIHIEFCHVIAPSNLVRALIDTGWGAGSDGTISVLAPTFFGLTRVWTKLDNPGTSPLLKWAEAHDKGRRGLRFALTHKPSEIGGTMTIARGRRSLDWVIHGNIPYIFPDRIIVDVSKCLEIIFPAINSASKGCFEVEGFITKVAEMRVD